MKGWFKYDFLTCHLRHWPFRHATSVFEAEDNGITIVDASSDMLVIDITNAEKI
jgi:hypothetical protein